MKIPRISNEALDAVAQRDVMRSSPKDDVKRFAKEQPALVQCAFEICQECGWTEEEFSAAMTLCRVAFDALSNQISLDELAISNTRRRLG